MSVLPDPGSYHFFQKSLLICQGNIVSFLLFHIYLAYEQTTKIAVSK